MSAIWVAGWDSQSLLKAPGFIFVIRAKKDDEEEAGKKGGKAAAAADDEDDDDEEVSLRLSRTKRGWTGI